MPARVQRVLQPLGLVLGQEQLLGLAQAPEQVLQQLLVQEFPLPQAPLLRPV